MNADQIKEAAAAAVRAMDDKTKAAFIAMFEAGDENAVGVARVFAIEGVSRQVRLASMALESSRIMDGLVTIVRERAA
jgi:hypothetical protein